MVSQSFSERHGYARSDVPIVVREDAPGELRYGVAAIATGVDLSPSQIRSVVCKTLWVEPDRSNWSEYPNVWDEVLRLLSDCDWFKVYDVAEALYQSVSYGYHNRQRYEAELNRLFREKGIGWEMVEGHIRYRGDPPFAATTAQAVAVLDTAGFPTASNEVQEALRDLSRRPTPDVTGAIQHSMTALECVGREITGKPKATLGELVHSLELPPAIKEAVPKLWGFASENGRHLREGRLPTAGEVELVVSVACALSTYLATTARG